MVRIDPSYRNSGISVNYVPTWQLKEGIRELIQNQYDAIMIGVLDSGGTKDDLYVEMEEVKFDPAYRQFKFKDTRNDSVIGEILYDPITQCLTLWNPGTINKNNLLLGGTNKQNENRAEIVGRFGEGMKLSILGLLRPPQNAVEGYVKKTVVVKTASEVWNFKLQQDRSFLDDNGNAEECLHYKFTSDTGAISNRTTVTVHNLSVIEWRQQIKHFIKLTDEKLLSIRVGGVTHEGELLLGDSLRRRVFVKGIHVHDTGDNVYGYNFYECELDRDRRCIPNVYARYHRTSCILAHVLDNIEQNRIDYPEAISELDGMYEIVYNNLSRNSNETYYFHTYRSEKVATRLFDKWRARNNFDSSNPTMPSCPGPALQIEKYLRNNHISLSVYPYQLVSWELWHTFQKAKQFKNVQSRVKDYRDNATEYHPDVGEQKTVEESIRKIRLAEPTFTPDKLKWKELDIKINFSSNNVVYLSWKLLKDPVEGGFTRVQKISATILRLLDTPVERFITLI